MFKKHKFKIAIICTSSIVILMFAIYFSGGFKFGKVPTAENEPTIKSGSWVIYSNFLPYNKDNIFVYEHIKEGHPFGKYIQRLVGIGGDKIFIKNGLLYVNDSLFDSKLNLKHSYIIDSSYLTYLLENGANYDREIYQFSDSQFVANLEDKNIKEHFFSKRYYPKIKNNYIQKTFGKEWTPDNFGPVIVPANKLFFLGDNRNASLDSRYYGFVDKEDVIGKVFYPKN